MIDCGIIRSTVEPEVKVIDDLSVWVNTDIISVEDGDGDQAFSGFKYHQVRYNKDEYIKLMDAKNATLETQLTDTQIALCEVYELMGVNDGESIC